jgi:hypothetical protein
MSELDKHLLQGKNAIVAAAVDGTIKKAPIKEVKIVLGILVEEKVLTREQAAGVLLTFS